MRCRQVEARLADYTEDLLDARKRERVEAHLAECEACRAAAEDTRLATEALRGLVTPRPPSTFAPRIRSAVRAQAPRALAPPLLRQDLRAALGGAFLMLVFGTLVTHYLAQARPYVAATSVGMVAMESLTPVATAPSPALSGPPAARPAPNGPRPTLRPTRTSHPRLGTDRSLSAMTGTSPSRDRFTPKPAAAPGSAGARALEGPQVSRPSVSLAALTDSSAGPRLVEDSPEAGPRRVALPVAESLSAPGSTTTVMVADRGAHPGVEDASVSPATGGTGEAAASFGFEELFNESSLPRYADVS